MTITLTKGRFSARPAQQGADLRACQRLRQACFRGVPGLDCDPFDEACSHLMIENGDDLLATCRLHLGQAGKIGSGYAGQFYDLTRLAHFPAPVLEIGRLCIRPDVANPEILRVLWGAIAQVALTSDVGLIFGCASFPGSTAAPYARGLRQVWHRHRAPQEWAPQPGVRHIITDADLSGASGRAPMPSLLRSYLGLGGWVSDHAVVDRDLETFHLFVGVETAKIPPARAAAIAGLGC